MLQKYERKAEDILEKLAQEEPNERNFKMMSEALIILGGGKVMEMMGGGQMSRYDGMREEYQRGGRGGRGGRGRTRVSGYTRRRYDGMEDDMMGDWDEDEMYYDGGREEYQRGGSSGGGSGGGRSGGGGSGRSGGGGMGGGR